MPVYLLPLSRRQFLAGSAGTIGLELSHVRANEVLCCRNAGPRETLEIGSQRQLFLDDHIIERIAGLKRTMHQPVKRGAVIKPDQEWEISLPSGEHRLSLSQMSAGSERPVVLKNEFQE